VRFLRLSAGPLDGCQVFKTKTPTVKLLERINDGAAFSWNCAEARAVALEIFVELARRLERQRAVQRLRLSGRFDAPIDVADVAAFVGVAPELLNQPHQAYEFDFRINDVDRAYSIRHLDQGVSGITFHTPVQGEVLWSTLGGLLAEYNEKGGSVRVLTDPWYPSEPSKT
jgi:hypothetical protein